MIIKKLQNLDKINGNEGTIISQIFHPHNTLSGIRYSVSHSTIKPRKRSKRHKMKTSEIYYVLEGNGVIHIDKESQIVSIDDAVYIPPFSIQFIENTGTSDLKFLCIVDPAWKKEDELTLE
ncbi:MAG: cupin domain-containing protein [Nitrosopumilaceae archaeon]|nr:cupin domain-containing protein [Nitrosopumilaceae archaeon]